MLQLQAIDLKEVKTETMVIPVCEDKEIYGSRIISSLVKKAKELKDFKGEKDDEISFYHPSEVKADRIIFLGLGKEEKINYEVMRKISGKAVKKCIKKKLSEVLFAVPSAKNINMDMYLLLEAMMEGAYLGNHLFDKYKTDKKSKPLKNLNFLAGPEAAVKFSGLPSQVASICEGTILAREWVSTPSNDKKPDQFAESIITSAEKEKINVSLLGEKELEEENFGAILSVSRGSQCKPKLVILEYRPDAAKKTIVLVGKGVTFDSGGINLKPAGSLEDMKMDMSGAAAVAATIITAARLKLEINLIGALPIVENMPSGDASRPGDIIKSYSGKTVEIGNTDAEGRLILIDAISYMIKKYKPQTLIDIATLTGACVVALGEKIAGVFSFDDQLAQTIIQAGEKTYERCWRLPLPDDYKELLKSDFADLKNVSSSRWGGAITASLFLSEFVNDTTWAHIDIAGPAYIKKENEYCGVGGTGFGVRLFCDILKRL